LIHSLTLRRHARHRVCSQVTRTFHLVAPRNPFWEPRLNASRPACKAFLSGAGCSKRLFTRSQRLPVLPSRHYKVNVPGLFLHRPTAPSSDPFGCLLRRSPGISGLGGLYAGARCPIPALQFQPLPGSPLPLGALSNPFGSTRSTRFPAGKRTLRLRPIALRSPLPFLLV
jgi:hypothetical protein